MATGIQSHYCIREGRSFADHRLCNRRLTGAAHAENEYVTFADRENQTVLSTAARLEEGLADGRVEPRVFGREAVV